MFFLADLGSLWSREQALPMSRFTKETITEGYTKKFQAYPSAIKSNWNGKTLTPHLALQRWNVMWRFNYLLFGSEIEYCMHYFYLPLNVI